MIRLACMLLLVTCLAKADYELQRRHALALAKRQPEAALAALEQLHNDATNVYQQTDALTQAAQLAWQLERPEQAFQLAARIPLAHRALTLRLRFLARQEAWHQIVDEAAEVDFSSWPSSAIADAAYYRGTAYRRLDQLALAHRDLTIAARHSDRIEVFFDLGELSLKLGYDVQAMDAFERVQRVSPDPYGWQFYTAVTTRATILLRHDFYSLTLPEVDKASVAVKGYWRGRLLYLRGQALAGLGRREEAVATFQRALAEDDLYSSQRQLIQDAISDISP